VRKYPGFGARIARHRAAVKNSSMRIWFGQAQSLATPGYSIHRLPFVELQPKIAPRTWPATLGCHGWNKPSRRLASHIFDLGYDLTQYCASSSAIQGRRQRTTRRNNRGPAPGRSPPQFSQPGGFCTLASHSGCHPRLSSRLRATHMVRNATNNKACVAAGSSPSFMGAQTGSMFRSRRTNGHRGGDAAGARCAWSRGTR
jgi:hypothetical protein